MQDSVLEKYECVLHLTCPQLSPDDPVTTRDTISVSTALLPGQGPDILARIFPYE